MPGRNEMCPCGSGKKYKKCCLLKKEINDITIGQPVKEEDVISELLKASQQFESFYRSERIKIKEPISWIHDASMPEGSSYEASRLRSGTLLIKIRTMPVVSGEATNIAHELQHLIIDAEGFPSTTSNIHDLYHIELSTALNSMLHDPLVDSRLEKYDFDLWPNYYKEEEEAISQFGKAPYPPPNYLTKVFWILAYSSFILDWKLRNKTIENPSKFQLWFDARFPAVTTEGQELLTLVQTVCFDTPEKMSILLNEIIQKYKLRWLTIVKP
jgi:hypothetical protein